MATTPKIFELDGSIKIFPSDVPIKGKDYTAVYISNSGLLNTYELIPQVNYDVANDSVVFTTAPTGRYLRLVVGTNRAEMLNSPSNIATVAVNMDTLNFVKENIDAIIDSYNVIATADNINLLTNIGNNLINLVPVGQNITAVTSLNLISNHIVTVSGISEFIEPVAINATKVVTVSDNITKVVTVSDNITNVNNVGTNITKVNNVSDNMTKVNTIHADLISGASKVDVVASNIINVNKVGLSIDNVNSVANNLPSIVNRAKFKVKSEATISLDTKTNPAIIPLVGLPDMVGFEVHGVTNSVKNTSGRDLDIIGNLAIHINSTATTDTPIYIYSENSVDGTTWNINPESLRKVKIVKEGADYVTIPSLLVSTKWINGTYNRFRVYKEGSGNVSILSVTDTIGGATVVGHSFIWTIHEV